MKKTLRYLLVFIGIQFAGGAIVQALWKLVTGSADLTATMLITSTTVVSVLTIIVFLAGMMLSDADVMFSGILLFLGWLAIFAVCFMGKERSFFKLMSKEELLMKATDPENIIFVYLFIKAVILVLAHYFNLSMKHSLVSPFLF